MLFVNLTRVNCSPGTVHEGPNSSERDSTNYAPLSVYSTISNVVQIGVYCPVQRSNTYESTSD